MEMCHCRRKEYICCPSGDYEFRWIIPYILIQFKYEILYFDYLTFTTWRDNPRMGLNHFVRKLLWICLNGLFWLGPIYKLFKSHVYYVLMWILWILGPVKILKRPIKRTHKNFKCLLKLGNMHVLERDK